VSNLSFSSRQKVKVTFSELPKNKKKMSQTTKPPSVIDKDTVLTGNGTCLASALVLPSGSTVAAGSMMSVSSIVCAKFPLPCEYPIAEDLLTTKETLVSRATPSSTASPGSLLKHPPITPAGNPLPVPFQLTETTFFPSVELAPLSVLAEKSCLGNQESPPFYLEGTLPLGVTLSENTPIVRAGVLASGAFVGTGSRVGCSLVAETDVHFLEDTPLAPTLITRYAIVRGNAVSSGVQIQLGKDVFWPFVARGEAYETSFECPDTEILPGQWVTHPLYELTGAGVAVSSGVLGPVLSGCALVGDICLGPLTKYRYDQIFPSGSAFSGMVPRGTVFGAGQVLVPGTVDGTCGSFGVSSPVSLMAGDFLTKGSILPAGSKVTFPLLVDPGSTPLLVTTGTYAVNSPLTLTNVFLCAGSVLAAGSKAAIDLPTGTCERITPVPWTKTELGGTEIRIAKEKSFLGRGTQLGEEWATTIPTALEKTIHVTKDVKLVGPVVCAKDTFLARNTVLAKGTVVPSRCFSSYGPIAQCILKNQS
jgi:hypothetical protein